MSSLTAPKPGNAARMLAELNAADAPQTPDEQPPVNTDIRTNGHTNTNTNGSTDNRTAASTDTRKEGQPQAQSATRTDSPTAARKSTRPSARPAASEDGFVDKVKARIASREPLEGGSKTTLEYSPDISRRIKQYCLDKGKDMNGRVILTALLTTFLEEEGY